MDQIIVLKNGEISEQGTFEELLAKEGEFQEFLLQYLSEGNDEDEGKWGTIMSICPIEEPLTFFCLSLS